jgi:hypothetical protein
MDAEPLLETKPSENRASRRNLWITSGLAAALIATVLTPLIEFGLNHLDRQTETEAQPPSYTAPPRATTSPLPSPSSGAQPSLLPLTGLPSLPSLSPRLIQADIPPPSIFIPPTPSPTSLPEVTGEIAYPANSTSAEPSFVVAQEQANGPISLNAVEDQFFAATQLVGSVDGREISTAMKEAVFVYPVSINQGSWTATVFFGKNEETYRNLVFTLYLFRASPAAAPTLRATPGQAYALNNLRPYVYVLDAHGVVRR